MNIARRLLYPFRYALFFLKWRRRNKHNTTVAMNVFHAENVQVGKCTYGPVDVQYDNGSGKLTIGNYCSIAKNVKFFLGGGHNYLKISTFPFYSKVYGGNGGHSRNERIDIVVEDDVWIGYDCIVLAGSKIGKGSVIGARSIVRGTIPPYSVYVHNKVIKQRFPNEIIERIKDIDFGKVRHERGDDYQKYCNTEITVDNIDAVMESFAGE